MPAFAYHCHPTMNFEWMNDCWFCDNSKWCLFTLFSHYHSLWHTVDHSPVSYFLGLLRRKSIHQPRARALEAGRYGPNLALPLTAVGSCARPPISVNLSFPVSKKGYHLPHKAGLIFLVIPKTFNIFSEISSTLSILKVSNCSNNGFFPAFLF